MLVKHCIDFLISPWGSSFMSWPCKAIIEIKRGGGDEDRRVVVVVEVTASPDECDRALSAKKCHFVLLPIVNKKMLNLIQYSANINITKPPIR
jgi:hypothetical protein